MEQVCIKKNIQLCHEASLKEENEIYAINSDIALIESKLPGMNNEDKARAKKTMEYIRTGKRRYTGGVFEPRSERKRIL